MNRYPTPPSTSSPKYKSSFQQKNLYENVPPPTDSYISSYPQKSEIGPTHHDSGNSYTFTNFPPAMPAPTDSYISYPNPATQSKITIIPQDSISNYPDNTIASHPFPGQKASKETVVDSYFRDNNGSGTTTKVEGRGGEQDSYFDTPGKETYYINTPGTTKVNSHAPYGTSSKAGETQDSYYDVSSTSKAKSNAEGAQDSYYDNPPASKSKSGAQDSYYDSIAHSGAQDSYYDNSKSHSGAPESYFNTTKNAAKLAAQDSYYQTSIPGSPSYAQQSQRPYGPSFDPSFPDRPGPPPRRSSSPALGTGAASSYYYAPPQIPHSTSLPSSPKPYRPISPSRRPLSPFSLSRPKPRPGLIKRMSTKLSDWIRSLFNFSKHNPLKMGLLTFIPVLLGAGLVKTVKGIKHLLTGKGSGGKEGKLGKEMRGEAKKMEKKWHEEVFRDFKGFGGSKAGPLDGLLKIVQMLVNHYCKLSPSAVPRAASIILELYFLDVKKQI